MKTTFMNITVKRLALVLPLFLCSCQYAGNLINPFYDTPGETADLGERSDRALNNNMEKADSARKALDAMASYQRAHDPKPENPVMQPSVVRLMWVPDHLNRNGDLVPAHYYYLKVLKDRWALQDAFEQEAQLGSTTGGSGNVPYVQGDDIGR